MVKTEDSTVCFASPIGRIEIRAKKECLCQIAIIADGETSDQCRLMDGKEPASALLQRTYEQISQYFQGKRKTFDLPLSYQGTVFQKQVWHALRQIPYGETRSYGDIAKTIGRDKAVRAVGNANNKNPLPLVIPCHRVIHKNGELGGFACGLQVKQYLLNLEKQ